MQTLNDLFVDELRQAYNAEKQIVDALPIMVKSAKSSDLKHAFEDHKKRSELQIGRLAQVFDQLGLPAHGKKCIGIEGIIDEGQKLLRETDDPNVRDAALIGAAQRVEHYEMAMYGTLRSWARILGYGSLAELLQETLNEEGATDKKLTDLAMRISNPKAAEGEAAA